MADNKEIKFKAIMDMSDFDTGIQKVQARLKQLSATDKRIMGQGTDQGGALTPQAQAQRERFQEKVKRYAELETQRLDKSIKKDEDSMKKKEQALERIRKLQKEIGDDEEKQQKLKDMEIENLEKQLDLEDKITKKKEQQAELSEKTGQIGSGTGGQESQQQGAMARFAGMLRMVAGSAVLGGALNLAGTIGEDIITRRGDMARSRGRAYAGAARDMREEFEGRGSDRTFYARERAEAADILRDEYEDKRSVDMLKGGAGGLAGGIAGGAAGAAAGSAIGATLGGLAAIGATILTGGVGIAGAGAMVAGGAAAGKWIGGALGAAGGAYMGMGEKGRYALFDPERYDADRMAEAFEQREQLEQTLIMRDPKRFMARQSFMGNVDRYADIQRRTGLGDEDLYGETGFLQVGMRRGEMYGGRRLREKDLLAAQGQMQEVSGLTQGSMGMAAMAASLRRGGIGNAADIMGRLYGATGDEQGTEDATKRLMAEAVRMGVDTSTMPQELKNFTTVAADLATQGGGFSESMAQMLAASGAGMSMQALEAGASEMQEFQQRGGQGAGFEGQLGLGFFQGDKADEAFGKEAADKLRKDPNLMNTLNQLTAQDLEKDPALLKGYAAKLGISEEQLLEGMGKKDIFKQTRTQKGEDLMNKFAEATKGMTQQELDEYLMTEEGSALYTEMTTQRTGSYGAGFIRSGKFRRRGEIGLASGRKGKAMDLTETKETPFMLQEQEEPDLMNQLTGGLFGPTYQEGKGPLVPKKAPEPTDMDKILRDVYRKDSDSAAEDELGARGTGDLARIRAINENADAFSRAAKATTEQTVLLATQFAELKKRIDKSEGGLVETLETLQDQLDSVTDMLNEKGFSSTK